MTTENQPTATAIPTQSGAFAQTLFRNNTKIREDRAASIIEAAQLVYRREIEDMRIEKKQLERDRVSLLDLSPTDANSLKLVSDFDAKKFAERDIQIGVKLRQLDIKLEVAIASYQNLFGETI